MKQMILMVLFGLALTSCARDISTDVYASRQVGEVSTTYEGVVRSVRPVTVEQAEQLENNKLGITGGGLAGGMIGSAVGKGNLAPAAIGALAGAVAGSFAEKKLKSQTALEYTVQLGDGSLLTVVQGQDQTFGVGQPVFVIASPCGRSRIVSQ